MFRIDHNSSVFSGECIAIIHAVEYILENCVKKVTVFTDSRSVVDIISSNRIDKDYNYLVLALKNKLRPASLQRIDNSRVMDPCTCGILGNETADLLAREAIGRGKPLEYLLSHDFYALSRKRYIKTTGDFLIDQARYNGSQYFDLYPPFTSYAWFSKLKFGRTEIVTICRIRSNHYNNLNYSLNRYNIVDFPACDCEAPQQDINHIFWSCPALSVHRGSLLCSLEWSLKLLPPYIFDLLNPSYRLITPIVSFLRKNDILI